MDFSDFLDGLGEALTNLGRNIGDILKPFAELLGFKDQEVYQYYLGSARLIDEDDEPTDNQLTRAIISSTISGSDISDEILLLLMTGARSVMERYVNYGENTYINGLPQVTIKGLPNQIAAFQLVLNSILSGHGYTPTEIVTPTILIPSAYDIGLSYLQDNHGYTTSMVIASETYSYVGFKINPSPPTYAAGLMRISGELGVYTSITIPDAEVFLDRKHYHYSSTVTDGVDTFPYKFVFPHDYAGPNDEYPSLLESTIGDETAPEFFRMFPIAILKKKGIYTKDGETDYESTKTLLKITNIDYDELVENLEDEPDMEDVTDAFILFGINIQTTYVPLIGYLYQFFRFIGFAVGIDSFNVYNTTEAKDFDPIMFKTEEGSYNTTLIFNYIRIEIIEEVIGDVDTVEKVVTVLPNILVPVGIDIQVYDDTGNDEANPRETFSSETIFKSVNVSTVVFKLQINSTHCEQLTIHGLELFAQLRAIDNTVSIQSIQLSDEDNFLIPLSYTFFNLFGIIEAEQLIYETYHLVLFASLQTHIDWYTSTQFLEFLQAVITVIIIIKSGGTAAATAGDAVKRMFYQWVIRQIFTVILESGDFTDVELGALIILYVFVSTEASGGDFGNIDNILLSVSAVTEGITIYTGIELDLLESDAAQLEKDTKALQDELDEAEALLSDSAIDSLYLTTLYNIRYETPKDFFLRTLDTDTTSLALSYTDNFHDNSINSALLTI